MLTASRSASSAASAMSPEPPSESESLPASQAVRRHARAAAPVETLPSRTRSMRIRIGWLGRRSTSRRGEILQGARAVPALDHGLDRAAGRRRRSARRLRAALAQLDLEVAGDGEPIEAAHAASLARYAAGAAHLARCGEAPAADRAARLAARRRRRAFMAGAGVMAAAILAPRDGASASAGRRIAQRRGRVVAAPA